MGDRVESEQISHRLKLDFPDDESMRISHGAIYQSLFHPGSWRSRTQLVACLRTGGRCSGHGLERGTGRMGTSRPTSCSLSVLRRPLTAPSRALGGRPDHRNRSFRDRHDR